ncbi:beta-lactamase/transpeptidase-like protein [Macroventuria anomochaeta]|uniref:Beta-lactamase/transpeptidase-like protein n=2 Tax=Macroventuria anomochaeta TaxID=301207 RepID=A0ACB6RH61_9PLEO|nr:beta-lactamase/transpeptidase-like protein [Macroventuria anomochaeta]XP_033567328.1 beta-lactamase/transpeptidase-like protein [Macroventuria anomochaeta]KAF2621109.1 beta-lactamase/transpeptidase-like protein [Macroventuria anomochaeta]KAF2633139.1 beta-lactamase/transpeptidase-like protein [Macroventuria anomochaeta]
MKLLFTTVVAAVASAKCYEPTFAHPLPEYDANDALLKHAFAEINTAIISAVAAPEFSATSLSVEITTSKETLWSKHHTANERNASRPDIPEVNGDALYRIASITKTFTVLGILFQEKAGNLSLDDPVNKYIQELKEDQNGTLPWKDITLRNLASQLSGIPRECALHAKPWPLVSWSGCQTLEDLLGAVKSQIPIFAPNQQSTYSNVAFELLGIVLERVAGQDYRSYIEEAIFKSLDMSKSTLSVPPDEAGVIPSGDHYWDVDEGIQSPTGGIYSSSKDLSKYLRYVLTHYNGLTHALNWFNPASPSRGLSSFYGIPWEIFHTDRVLQDSRRTVRFVTKGGGLPGYTSIIILAPEYDLGFTILVAGNSELLLKLQNIVTKFIRPAEQLAVQQLQERYAGTYVSSNSSLNSSVTLVADHRGLVVTEFISNSSDILNLGSVKHWIPRHGFAQLVPTLLYRNAQDQKGEEWRLQAVENRDHDERAIWDDFCMTDIEGPLYAAVPINNFVFWDQGQGEGFETLELSAFRTNLTRVPGKGLVEKENIEL